MRFSIFKEYIRLCEKHGLEPSFEGLKKYSGVIKSHKKIPNENIRY